MRHTAFDNYDDQKCVHDLQASAAAVIADRSVPTAFAFQPRVGFCTLPDDVFIAQKHGGRSRKYLACDAGQLQRIRRGGGVLF
jgi:hypothetical protein